MTKKHVIVPAAVMLLALATGGQVSAQGQDSLARFDGGIGVNAVAGLFGDQNPDLIFPNVILNRVRGVNPSNSIWRIAGLKADVDTDGNIKVRGRGLVLAVGNRIGQSLNLEVIATLICEEQAPFVPHSTTTPVKLDPSGNFRIDDTLDSVPSECGKPVLLIRTAAGWIAAGIPKLSDE
jgi:hypothetical protein